MFCGLFAIILYLFLLRKSFEVLLVILYKQSLFIMCSPHGVTFPSEGKGDGKVRPERGTLSPSTGILPLPAPTGEKVGAGNGAHFAEWERAQKRRQKRKRGS